MIGDGDLDGAATRLSARAKRLPGEQIAGLRLMLARARIARGELDQAEATLTPDSSVAALALRGWVALYRGDLADAVSKFRDAGPYAGDRADATRRSEMVALLQRVGQEKNADLGAALLALARGDSAGAIAGLRHSAGGTASPGDVLLLAGRIAARMGGPHEADAATLFEQVVQAGGTGAAPPAAELAWAQLLVRQGRGSDAIPRLEHLILSYPTSAAVPEARRELERAKGAIPRS
jgi:tetratricopeptide (TPR) repeat protein